MWLKVTPLAVASLGYGACPHFRESRCPSILSFPSHPTGFFFLFAAASACFVPVIYCQYSTSAPLHAAPAELRTRHAVLYPETSGLSLELLDLAFMGQVESNPVKESARLRELLRTSRDGETAAAHELVMETAKPTIEHKENFF